MNSSLWIARCNAISQERQGILAFPKHAGFLPIFSTSKDNRFVIENKSVILTGFALSQNVKYENAEKPDSAFQKWALSTVFGEPGNGFLTDSARLRYPPVHAAHSCAYRCSPRFGAWFEGRFRCSHPTLSRPLLGFCALPGRGIPHRGSLPRLARSAAGPDARPRRAAGQPRPSDGL